MQTWANWQSELVTTLGVELEELVLHVSVDDVDWQEWHHLYLEGHSPRETLDKAWEDDP